MKFSRLAASSVLGLAVAGASAVGAVAAPVPADHSAPVRQLDMTSTTASLTPQPNEGWCAVWWKGGVGYTAGYSYSSTAIVGYGAKGNQVKEVQCLLRHRGKDPKALDGVYGKNTKSAVVRAQRHCHITQDGVVGPKTWRCLRSHWKAWA